MHFKTLCSFVTRIRKQSPDNELSVALSQRTNSPRLIEDETFNDSDIINNLIDYVDGQEEPDSLRADKILAGIQLSNKLKKHFLKKDTNSRKEYEISKRASITHIWLSRHLQETYQPTFVAKLISYFMVPKINQLKLYLQVMKAILNLFITGR
ncbi:uncharacterized protein TNCV_369211 [Trichonephila clavipes]|nr:uncharacterized protein TNCV_369211 [Trichonephila clavipes]